jgi:uncharacterized protein (DUF488 family)
MAGMTNALGLNMTLNEVWTVGHSNRDVADFLAVLGEHEIQSLADVRRFPGSRRWPQFGRAALAASLADAGIAYHHFPELGGRRTAQQEDSPNDGWRVAAFRAYADYLLTAEGERAFNELRTLAGDSRTAIMCAEALPWRCHRRLLADRFVVLGWGVFDIMSPGKAAEHALTEFARVDDGRVTYPAGNSNAERLLF